jgi:hypothetical protein
LPEFPGVTIISAINPQIAGQKQGLAHASPISGNTGMTVK